MRSEVRWPLRPPPVYYCKLWMDETTIQNTKYSMFYLPHYSIYSKLNVTQLLFQLDFIWLYSDITYIRFNFWMRSRVRCHFHPLLAHYCKPSFNEKHGYPEYKTFSTTWLYLWAIVMNSCCSSLHDSIEYHTLILWTVIYIHHSRDILLIDCTLSVLMRSY